MDRPNTDLNLQNTINQQEWERSENCTSWFCIYRSPRDTRILVPKRNPRFGYTLNFAHRAAWRYLVGLSSVPIGLLLAFLSLSLAK